MTHESAPIMNDIEWHLSLVILEYINPQNAELGLSG